MIKLGITDDLAVSIANDIRIEKRKQGKKGIDIITLTSEEFDSIVVAIQNLRSELEVLEEILG